MPIYPLNKQFWRFGQTYIALGLFLLLTTPFTAKAQSLNINAQDLIQKTNEERQNIGLKALTPNPKLTEAALAKAQDMLNKDYFAHTSPSGISPWFWFDQAGYDYVYAGENLALGFTTSDSAHKAWMASPGHKANIVNCHYLEIGMAVLTGEFENRETTVAVQMFGSLEDVDCNQPQVSSDQSEETPASKPEADITPPRAPEFTSDLSVITNFNQPTISGLAEAGSKIGLYLKSGQSLGITTTDNTGNWQFTFKNPLTDNDYKIYAQAFDKAGNASTQSRTLSLKIDTQSPAINQTASFVKPNPKDPLNSFVIYVNSPDQDVAEVTAISNSFSESLKLNGRVWSGNLPHASGQIKVILKDKAGNHTTASLNFLASTAKAKIASNLTTKLQGFNNSARNIATVFLVIGLIIFLARFDFNQTDDEPDEILI